MVDKLTPDSRFDDLFFQVIIWPYLQRSRSGPGELPSLLELFPLISCVLWRGFVPPRHGWHRAINYHGDISGFGVTHSHCLKDFVLCPHQHLLFQTERCVPGPSSLMPGSAHKISFFQPFCCIDIRQLISYLACATSLGAAAAHRCDMIALRG